MQSSNAPNKLTLPFAYAGGRNVIPAASQISTTPGAASLVDGFPPLTRTPIAAGGVPPSGLDMNGILYELSALLNWLNAGASFAYDAAFATDSNVNGYPKGARVMRSDGTGYWLNTVDGNTVDPESVTVGQAITAGWVPDLTNGVASVTMASANVTLTPAQYGKPVISLSGTLTANLNLNFPDNLAGAWTVDNNCAGNFFVNCKTTSGAGVVIAPGETRQIFSDGTNIQATATLGNYQDGQQIQGNITLGQSDVGKSFQIAANGVTVTVPKLSGVRRGATLSFVSNVATATTLVTQGSDFFGIGGTGGVSTIKIPAGECLTLVSIDGGSWFAISGTSILPHSPLFGSSIAPNGYKKIPDKNSPSGYFIIQWGELASPGTSGTLTFPIAFPNSVLSITPAMNGTVPITSTLAFNLLAPLTTGIDYVQSANVAWSWIAIGY